MPQIDSGDFNAVSGCCILCADFIVNGAGEQIECGTQESHIVGTHSDEHEFISVCDDCADEIHSRVDQDGPPKHPVSTSFDLSNPTDEALYHGYNQAVAEYRNGLPWEELLQLAGDTLEEQHIQVKTLLKWAQHDETTPTQNQETLIKECFNRLEEIESESDWMLTPESDDRSAPFDNYEAIINGARIEHPDTNPEDLANAILGQTEVDLNPDTQIPHVTASRSCALESETVSISHFDSKQTTLAQETPGQKNLSVDDGHPVTLTTPLAPSSVIKTAARYPISVDPSDGYRQTALNILTQQLTTPRSDDSST